MIQNQNDGGWFLIFKIIIRTVKVWVVCTWYSSAVRHPHNFTVNSRSKSRMRLDFKSCVTLILGNLRFSKRILHFQKSKIQHKQWGKNPCKSENLHDLEWPGKNGTHTGRKSQDWQPSSYTQRIHFNIILCTGLPPRLLKTSRCTDTHGSLYSYSALLDPISLEQKKRNSFTSQNG